MFLFSIFIYWDGMVWHGMFRVVPFAFSVEKSTPDGKKYASGAGALVTNHSYGEVVCESKECNKACRDHNGYTHQVGDRFTSG